MKDKKLQILLLVLLLLLLTYSIYLIFFKKDTPNVVNNQRVENVEDMTDDTLTPEEVLELLERDDNLGEDVQMSIIGPEGKIFSQGQARMWEAELENIESDDSFGVNCHWKFYLNENNEEVLYKEMENRSGVSKEDPTLCGFTSTFIDRIGKLRVVLNAEIVNYSQEVLETYTAEREYTVR